MGLTGDELVTKVLKACRWPSSNAPLTSAEILSLADDVIAGEFWPEAVRTESAYYAGALDYDITSGFGRYRLPKRAAGPLYDVLFVDAADTDRPDGISIPRITLEELGRTQNVNTECGFVHFIDGDFLGLWPVPDATEHTLRLRYPRAPSTLCLVAAAKQITTVDLDDGQFGASSPNGVWSVGNLLDVVGVGNAHQVLAEDLTVAVINASLVDFDTDLSGTGIAVSDWLATAGTTPLVQLPDSMIPALIRRVAEAALDEIGDVAGAQREGKAADRLSEKADKILERSDAEPRIGVCRNAPIRRML